MNYFKTAARAAWLALVFIGGIAAAQQAARLPDPAASAPETALLAEPTTTVYTEQGQLTRGSQNVTALGADLMGDRVNLYTGALEFNVTDVSLPGNNALPVAVGRRMSVGRDRYVVGHFGDWDLDIPRLSGVFDARTGWINSASGTNRCSGYSAPPNAVISGTAWWYPEEFWQGNTLYVPGSGGQEILLRSAANTAKPTDGQAYPLVSSANWQIRCLTTLANGTGEGFVAVSPDGTQYRFDWMATRPYPAMFGGDGTRLSRREVWILPTLITDRFGNTVTYSYDAVDPWKLTRIQASDGRLLTLTYTSVNGSSRIDTVTDGSRTWNYDYGNAGELTRLTLPDASSWQFNLGGLVPLINSAGEGASCEFVGAAPNESFEGSITHPSGAVGTFRTAFTTHSRAGVNKLCIKKKPALDAPTYAKWPKQFWVQSLQSKTLDGPGLPSMNWSYSYASTPSWAPCNGCSSTKTVQVTDARGFVTRFLFGTLFQVNEGQLLQQDSGWNGSTALRSTSYSYNPPGGAAYPEPIGNNPLEVADYLASRHRPQKQRITTQQGVNFSWLANNFDGFARPLSVTRSSGLGQSRTESTSYFDQLPKWVMGQIASVTDNATGTVMSQTGYNPTTALPQDTWRFGKLQASYGFNPDGTLATVKDGANQTTSYSNYKRGLAQNIGYADGTGESAVVNDIGLISSLSNAAGYTTGYGYDAIGRLNRITPPAGDPVVYNTTSIVFEPVGSTEYGLAAGHWRQTIIRGNARTVTLFDGLWRPLMQRSYDAADESNTRKVTLKAFDADGRVTFESYPQRDIASVGSTPAGKRGYFDALGRGYRVEADSELGTLVSTSEYLGGFQTRHTNPRGKATTQSFWALDNPGEAQLAGISAPAGVTVSIGRDGYGKPASITRGGLYNGQTVSVTRRYVYDSGQRLCKTVEPELGATVQDYDVAGNIAWRAPGQNLPGTVSCDTASVAAAAKISHSYTARNLPLTTSHGDGSPSISRTYTPDGLLKTIASNGSTWTYGYNALRLQSSETLSYGGQNYALGWGFDANGNTNAITYPGGATVAFNPNALGQPRQVGGYASAVGFHPNGAVAGYTLGNGIAHSLSQNARGLPLLNRDAGVLQDLYSYDANGNVTAIADQQESVFNRTLSYDDLDRLSSASAPGVWGNASYAYDPVDNLRSAVVGSRNSTLNYDAASNRLSSIVTNGSNTAYGYDALGNLRSKGLQTFGFDIASRLTSASAGGSYVYDGLGRRIKVASTDGSTRIQVYSRAGQLVWAVSSGGPRPAGTTAYIYLAGKQIAEAGSNGVTQYVHTDALGSPVAHTASNGALLNRTRFEPYGYTAAGTKPGPATSVIGFTGHVNDPETDLVYMQQRYYDPIAGRFLSIDPVVVDANTGGSFNRYEYGNSNPYGFTDPTGMDSQDVKPELVDVTGSRIPREAGGIGGASMVSSSGGPIGGGIGTGAGAGTGADPKGAGASGKAGATSATPWGSYLPGTDAGDNAAMHWANLHVSTGNPMYAVPGLLASLWTPDTALGTAITLTTGGLGGVKAIPEGLALGWKSSAGIWAHTYKHGGGGINFFFGGSRVFAVDYHAFKLNGVVASRLHYHRGLTPATQKLHRPYQGGP